MNCYLRVFGLLVGCLPCPAAVANTYSDEIDGITFQVRDGYRLTKIAGSDLVQRPTVCDWDDQGRLVVCESSGTHEGTEKQRTTKPHKLVRLIDDDDDGVFDRRIVAAEDLSFYSGVLCDGDDVYVSTPPSILKLTDADGDGVCESREIWHDGGTLTYCANDLHGPYKGPDGWIYWCKGAFGEQTHELVGGRTMTSKAAHVLRKRPEGGPVEIIISGGMDNPIELAWSPSGDLFFTSTFLHHPSGGVRDGIGHAVYGSVFGKRHNVIDGLPRTGDLMPVMTELGAAAPSGLTRLAIAHPDETVLACAQFNLHKVSSHCLVRNGATFTTIDQDLVSSDRLTFHPTDVIEDADGSLIFLDTGDWYDLCCPSSGAEASKATGGIYRLTKLTGAPKSKSSHFDGGENVVAQLNDWSCTGLEDVSDVVAMLKRSDTPAVMRAAAECIGRNGDASHLPALLERLSDASGDRVLEHSLLYAAMQIGDTEAIAAYLREDAVASSPRQLRAAILLLDQMKPNRLDPSVVLTAAFSSNDGLRDIASATLQRHDHWASALLPRVLEHWTEATHDKMVLEILSAWQSRSDVRDRMLAEIVGSASPERRITLLSTLSFDDLPAEWDRAVASLMKEATSEDRLKVANWLAKVPLDTQHTGVVSQLLRMLEEPNWSVADRLRLAAALPGDTQPRIHGASDLAVTTLLKSEHSDEQEAVRKVVQRLRLDLESAKRLLSGLDDVPTARLGTAAEAIANADESLAKELLKRLPSVKTARTLSPERLVGFFSNRDVGLQEEARAVAERIAAPPAEVADSLSKLMAEMPKGDMVRGMRVFHGAKAACGKCHEFGDVGGRIGPELTDIGKTRSRVALLEAIVYPSSHIAQGYRSVQVLTVDGTVHTGLVTGETSQQLELTTGIDRVVQIPKDDIEERRNSDTSIMPAGLDGAVSKQELADVMELLKVHSAW